MRVSTAPRACLPQRDDGWQSMGGEEQALLYTLEEISGSDYCLQEDAHGGSQVRHVSLHSRTAVYHGPLYRGPLE